MDGPMSGVNPDAVDSEVGNIWRALYKLEKGFDNIPAAKKIATKVCITIQFFPEFLHRDTSHPSLMNSMQLLN